ncbi:hypothetical protein [Arcicella rosea]|uniref:Lipoprotein n=1 Tax=Arcicella rosea TaxID=502909 RepID=A0A841EPQ0_9BACT|nr:hypothetical protein [Arcicella rosea]MBB6005215.1 hypothetical protein [Arcicella rosea]
MKRHIILLLTVFTVLSSCNNSNSEKQKELELKEKELSLKEQELKLKEKENTTQTNTPQLPVDKVEPAKNSELSNVENLIGYWFVPHGATINIKFKRDGNFEFNDYKVKLDKEELLKGTYQLENGTLTLFYDDRPKQKFKFYKGKNGDENYYIKKTGYYFVKGENGYDYQN